MTSLELHFRDLNIDSQVTNRLFSIPFFVKPKNYNIIFINSFSAMSAEFHCIDFFFFWKIMMEKINLIYTFQVRYQQRKKVEYSNLIQYHLLIFELINCVSSCTSTLSDRNLFLNSFGITLELSQTNRNVPMIFCLFFFLQL